MATRRQLEANRANAKRSTGPRSADGKAQSSKNSLAHGLTAQDIVIADEDPEEFERLRAGLQADFEPTSTIELELVERLAGLLWRLRRIPVLEGALLDARREETSTGAEDFTLPVTVMQNGYIDGRLAPPARSGIPGVPYKIWPRPSCVPRVRGHIRGNR